MRSRALAGLMLVTSLTGQGRIDEAVAMTSGILDTIPGLSSAVVVEQLRRVSVLLTTRASTFVEVPPLLELISEAVRQRAWIGALGLPVGAAVHG